MLALEHRARSFFLQCRASARCKYQSSFAVNRSSFPRRAFATASELEPLSDSSTERRKKPYYVTSPIFYVNSAPHVGHLYTLVLTDVLKRWAKLCGDEKATLLTGTDEHGMKIQKAAQRANTDVKLFCDRHAEQFKALCDAANISYDRFIRTTDADHKEVVEYVWNELNHGGYIYEASHEGWYCVSDETFYPETQVQRILDPSTGDTKIVSIETGKEVEWTSETNYHFRLSAFREPLLEHYTKNPTAIVPKQRMAFVKNEIENGLTDLSISRPSSRLSWGIRVPGDDSQTIYVWLDALLNYLTMTGYPVGRFNKADSIWPPDCQVIGKDIIRFHTIYWPAFLMALKLPVTDKFLSHAHWTMNNEKMSKSSGNGVNPFLAMDRYGVDTIRFYMAYHGGIVDDAMYENSRVAGTYNHVLKDGFGNLLQRVFKSKQFNVRESVRLVAQEANNSDTSSIFSSSSLSSLSSLSSSTSTTEFLSNGNGNDDDTATTTTTAATTATPSSDPNNANANVNADLEALHESIQGLRKQLTVIQERTDRAMKEPNPRTAAHHIVELIRTTNKFFHNAALWGRMNTTDPGERQLAHYGVYMSAEAIRIVAILLQPFMPERMKVALDMMEVDESKRTFGHARVGADWTYGCLPPAPAAAQPPPSTDGGKNNNNRKKAKSAGAGAPQLFPMLLSDN
ncbi:methionine-tRNA ligase [Exophiala spinifera]|uniref:Probable methionine--tRNA ligase, mitochondrial n=1 Tax=Exophiala spinifera TaxID=91928 RepID=A0A0D2BGY1_9EURO|nr:methionine-tRNA ligase [Exophiala spinifera]KIW17880.1 methionine-tRNA ligase [Exophiala spinifera]